MKAHLLHPDRDFDPRRPLPWNEQALAKDLALDTLCGAMAGEDKFVFDVARKLVLSGLGNDIGDILYRQDVLRDCLKNPDVVRILYGVAAQAVEEEKRHYIGSILGNHPATVLRRSVAMIEAFLGMLRQLSRIALTKGGNFHSEGWCAFLATVKRELDDAYFGANTNTNTPKISACEKCRIAVRYGVRDIRSMNSFWKRARSRSSCA